MNRSISLGEHNLGPFNHTKLEGQPPIVGSAICSTRRSLVVWAMTGVQTKELRKLKGLGETIVKMVQRLRQEKMFAEFEVERLKNHNRDLYGGNQRWREEAQKQARIVGVLEAFINKEMRMTAKDPRIKRLARLIAKASNIKAEPCGSAETSKRS